MLPSILRAQCGCRIARHDSVRMFVQIARSELSDRGPEWITLDVASAGELDAVALFDCAASGSQRDQQSCALAGQCRA